jgi:pimeloyl-ACP methyl ester carboxylesterase
MALSACGPSDTSGQFDMHPAISDRDVVNEEYPPGLRPLSFHSGGSKLNGLMYTASGPGPHPTVVLLHGYPGNERNLDLAQAMRRDGNNVLYFNYRGTWGSGGEFSVSNALEDVARALELVKNGDWAEKFRSDPERVALVGHSFGGFLGAITTAEDPDIACFTFIAGANLGAFGLAARADDRVRLGLESLLGSDMDTSGGPVNGDVGLVVDEIVERAEAWDLRSRASALSTRPLLLVAGERDEVLPKPEHHDPFLAALHKAGAEQVTEWVINDDHAISANRIDLAQGLIDWQQEECWRQ